MKTYVTFYFRSISKLIKLFSYNFLFRVNLRHLRLLRDLKLEFFKLNNLLKLSSFIFKCQRAHY